MIIGISSKSNNVIYVRKAIQSFDMTVNTVFIIITLQISY